MALLPERFFLLFLVGFQTQNSLFDMFLREDQLRRRIDRNFVHLLDRPLALGIKGTDGIHLVAPELDPDRNLLRQWEHI